MAQDFRANQIRTAQIIASGTDWAAKQPSFPTAGGFKATREKPNLGLLMFSSSYAEDYSGGIKDVGAMLNESGNEAWLIISGSSTAKTQLNRPREDGGSVLFMGDVIVSGTLFAKRQLIIIDHEVAGDFFVTNNTHLSGNLFVGPTSYSGSHVGGSVLSASSISPWTTDGGGSIGTDLITAFRGDENTPPMIAFNTIDPRTKRAIKGGSYPAENKGTGDDSYTNGPGSDTFFWVSGSKDSINSRFGGVACFGGDMVISGNIVVSGSNNIHDMSKDQILNNSSSIPPRFGHDYTFASPGIDANVKRYDRWRVHDKNPDHIVPMSFEYESIIQTSPTKTTGTGKGWKEVVREVGKFADIVLSSSYGRLVVSGTGDIAIGQMGVPSGLDGGVLRFASSGSSPLNGPQIRFDTSSVTYGIMKYGNRPITLGVPSSGAPGTESGFNGPHKFIGGTVTGSAGFFVDNSSPIIPNDKGQAIGYMFQGQASNTEPGDAGLYQNLAAASVSSPTIGGPTNTLILTAAHINNSIKVGTGKNLYLDGLASVRVSAGYWYRVSDAAPVIIKATGTATLSGSDGVSIHSDTGEIDITAAGSGADIDINAGRDIHMDGDAISIDATQGCNFTMSAADNNNRFMVLRATNSAAGTAKIDMDADDGITIDTLDTSDGIKIATVTSGVPIHIGHTTSEVIIGDNATVHGNLHVLGDFIKGHVISASMGDPLLLLNSGSVVPNSGGGIAIASGSKVVLPTPHPAAAGAATFNPAMVFGRDTASSRDTFLAGRLNTHNGSVISLATATAIDVRAAGYRTAAGMTLTASWNEGAAPYHVTMSNKSANGAIVIGSPGPSATGPLILSASQFSFERGKKLYFDEPNGQYIQCAASAPNQLIMKLGAAGLRFTGIPKLEFQGSSLSIEGGRHAGVRSQTLYLSASTASGNPGNIVLSGSHNLMFTGSDYSFKMGQGEKLYFDETTGEGGPYHIDIDTTNNRLRLKAGTGQIKVGKGLYVNGLNNRIGVNDSNPSYTIDAGSGVDGVIIRAKQTADDASGPTLRLQNTRNGAEGVAEDTAGTIAFFAQDDDQNETSYALITAKIEDSTDGAEKGRLEFNIAGPPLSREHKTLIMSPDQVLILSGGGQSTDQSDYTDLAFFVSGSINNANHQTVKGTALFGGDVVVSGALQVKNALTASGLATGHLTLTDVAATLGFFNASNNFIKKDSNNLTFRDVALGQTKTLTQLASLSVVDNSDVFAVTHGAPSYVVTTGSFSFDTDERPTNVTPAAGGPGSDTYFFVSGSRGSRNALATGLHQRGVALFTGDLHVSGTVTSDDSVFGGSLDDAYDTPQGGGAKTAGVGGTISVVPHAPLTLTVEGQTTSTVQPLLQLSGGIKVGQLRIAPNADSDGFYTKAMLFNTASNGEIIFGAGSATAEAFKINSNANVGIERNSGTGIGRKLFFRPSENTTYLQYTNTEAGSPGPRVLNIANRTTNGRISFSMGASGNPATGLGYEGILAVSGSIEPGADNLYDLGSPVKRFANLYTGDLHLRNDRGNWTIYEEPDMLVVVNNLTGKKYKMGLTPLEDDE